MLSGQKLDGGDLVIPPRKEASSKAGSAEAGNPSLIDFAGSDAPESAPATVVEANKQPNDIKHLLQSTGKPADGSPVLDFTQEMKKDVPHAEQK